MREVVVLVTGASAASIGAQCMKALRLSKIKCKIIATDTEKESLGLYKADKGYIVPKANNMDYIPTILDICREEGVEIIVPGSTPELIVLARQRQVFENRGVLVFANDSKVIDMCEDKIKTNKFLDNNKFKVPRSHPLNHDYFDLEYPIIVKPNKCGGGSRNIFLARDKEELAFFYDYLDKQGISPMAQEYIGSPTEEYTVGVLHSSSGELLGSIVLKRKVDAPLSTNQVIIDTNGEIYRISSGISQGYIDDYKDIKENAEKIADAIGSKGPLNIQCRKTKDGIYTFEINPRFSGTSSIRALCGFNELETLIRVELLGEKVKKMTYKKGLILRGLENHFVGDGSGV